MVIDMAFEPAFLKAEKESEGSRPKARDPHYSGLAAASYSLLAIIVFYVVMEIQGSGLSAGIAGMLSAYLVARFDSNLEWNRHAKHFADVYTREKNDDA
ncbi:MAG: hypothetical protein HC788_14135 [Sphingopyxis sp.]|nr:hypothetical protein [Sphingopyxis sp.]